MSFLPLLKSTASDSRLAGGAVAALSALALGTALTAQYGFGLQPCALCHYQRIPYVLTGLLDLLALFAGLKNKPKAGALALFLAALCFLAGAIIAAYHAGVEQHWWTSFLEGCKASFDISQGPDLLKQIESAGAARCDEIPWQDPLLGLSMAAWNALASLVLAAASLIAAVLTVRKANGF